MAAISPNLLAATAPPQNAPAPTASSPLTATSPNATTGFAAVLSKATSGQPEEPPVGRLELESDVTTAAAGAELAAVLATIGLVAQPVPVQPETTASGPRAATSAPAVGTVDIAAPALFPAATPPTPATPAASRSVELQFDTAPAARGTATPTPTLTDSPPTAPEAPVPGELTPAGLPTVPAGRRIPTVPTPNVAATTTEVASTAARPPAVAPQVPVVTDRAQQLPAQPAEVGYNLVGPTVTETPGVTRATAAGGTPSQPQVEQLAARRPTAETPVVATAAPTPPTATRFESELAGRGAASTPAVPTAATRINPGTPENPATPTPLEGASVTPAITPTRVALAEPAEPAAPPTVIADTPGSRPAPAATRIPPPVVSQPAGATTPVPEQAVPQPAEGTTRVAAEAFPRPAEAATRVPTQAAFNIQEATPATPRPALGEPAEGVTPTADAPTAMAFQPPPQAGSAPTASAATRLGPPAPPAPPVAAQMSDAFVTHARVIESGGTHEFQLRLDPPELGEVKVRVLAMGDRLEARLVVSDDAVKRLIESQLPELRQRLEAAGVNVPSFDVSTGGGKANTGGDGWDRSQAAFAPTPRPAAGPPGRPLTRPTAAGGLIDVTA